MTITCAPQEPVNAFGPGLLMRISSDFIGPIPIDAYWEIRMRVDITDLSQSFWNVQLASNGFHGINYTMMVDRTPLLPSVPPIATSGLWWPSHGQPIWVATALVHATAPLDTGLVATNFDAYSGLGILITRLVGSGTTSETGLSRTFYA